MNKKSSYTFEWTIGAIGIVFICLIVALYGTFSAISDLSHENELLVAQKETLEQAVKHIHCDHKRFKYDPITGSIYDNDTKDIYRKVGVRIEADYKLMTNGVVIDEGEMTEDVIWGNDDE